MIKTIVSKKTVLFVFLSYVLFLYSIFIGVDYGKFEPDYYLAHSITMKHLHQDVSFVELLRTIPNSASGVFPLWLYGFFDGLFVHRVISIFIVTLLSLIIAIKTKLNSYGCFLILSILVSPMIASSTAWVLPEILSIFVLLTVMLVDSISLSFFFSILVPISRQTFIVPLALRILYEPKNLIRYSVSILGASIGIVVLWLIWDGLVPPKLAGVHNTPSIKSAIVSLLIFCLYFFYSNLKRTFYTDWSKSKFFVTLLISAIIIVVNSYSPQLYGGGYIFSRLESYNLYFALFIELILLAHFLYVSDLRLIIFCTIASLSFCTTNYVFLKYIDFYAIAFVAYFITDVNPKFREVFERYAKSLFVFEVFSLILAVFYYN